MRRESTKRLISYYLKYLSRLFEIRCPTLFWPSDQMSTGQMFRLISRRPMKNFERATQPSRRPRSRGWWSEEKKQLKMESPCCRKAIDLSDLACSTPSRARTTPQVNLRNEPRPNFNLIAPEEYPAGGGFWSREQMMSIGRRRLIELEAGPLHQASETRLLNCVDSEVAIKIAGWLLQRIYFDFLRASFLIVCRDVPSLGKRSQKPRVLWRIQ